MKFIFIIGLTTKRTTFPHSSKSVYHTNDLFAKNFIAKVTHLNDLIVITSASEFY